jgi:hypothetical protein
MDEARKARMDHNQLKELIDNLRHPTETSIPFTELMNDAADELEEIMVLLEKQQVIIRRIYAEKLPDTWFVCGESGNKDQNGLPDRIEVCPAYGVGWTQLYQKTDTTIMLEGS